MKTVVRNFICILFLLFSIAVYSQATVADVKIQGNKKTNTNFLKRIIRVKPGSELDSTLIEKDIIRLKRLPAIAHAYFQVFKANNETEYNIYYGIEENFTVIPFANVYTSNNDEFAFRVGLQEFNFLGRNIIIGGFYQYDIFNSYGVNIRAPYLFSNKLGIAINYQDLTTQEPVFLENGTAEYRYNNESIEIMGLYEPNYRNRFELGLSFFTEDYSYLSGVTDPNVPQNLNVDKYLYKFIYDFNGLEYYYHYLSGFRSTLNLQLVRSKDQTLPDFTIGFNDFLFFLRVGKKGNWANRLRLGISSNLDTPFAPFAVDNNLNIRGVGNLIDRGTAAIVLNTEYRHTIIDKDWFVLQSNIFIDGGSWRNPGGDFGDFTDDQNLRVYPGVGIRFIHKRIFNAIFRIDYGHGVTKKASKGIVFGIGQYF
ncbi:MULTISPECIES: POTRA domain-containing protein [Croceitalea]|uniref:POTRA domain-containing protein n=1 Tax=Croceitalea vernalis TaxID=3075599 RepID=A0ABU3BDL9_9FLAO|nr:MULTISPECIES: POTRA domain-containing protein [unclassified Croceitalea]MDT0538273.1 POTRA domain-containing protein [Croceitalea sp. P059]MDT0620057.1 POTRA domain-containing protein [Croceitalea sp. P007]